MRLFILVFLSLIVLLADAPLLINLTLWMKNVALNFNNSWQSFGGSFLGEILRNIILLTLSIFRLFICIKSLLKREQPVAKGFFYIALSYVVSLVALFEFRSASLEDKNLELAKFILQLFPLVIAVGALILYLIERKTFKKK